jgi:hypothetical protein
MLTPKGTAENAKCGQIDEGYDNRWVELFLEQIVKRLASVVWPDRGKASRGWRLRNRYRGGSCILLYGRAERIKGAVVSSILFGNALWYRPGAFKLRRGVKVRTLLAAMKLKTAARTTAIGIKTLLQNGAAI